MEEQAKYETQKLEVVIASLEAKLKLNIFSKIALIVFDMAAALTLTLSSFIVSDPTANILLAAALAIAIHGLGSAIVLKLTVKLN